MPPPAPPEIDFLTLLVAFGALQAFLLALARLLPWHRRSFADRLLGFLLLGTSLLMLDQFLVLSRLMERVIWLNDFSEPVNYLVGPLPFLYIAQQIYPPAARRWYWHFAVAGIVLLNHITWYYQPDPVKWNAYIGAFPHRGPFLDYTLRQPFDPLHLKRTVIEVTVAHFLLYAVAMSVLYLWVRRRQLAPPEALRKAGRLVALNIGLVASYAAFRTFLPNDEGDLPTAIQASVLILLLAWVALQQPAPAALPPLAEVSPLPTGPKYARSSLSPEERTRLAAALRDSHLDELLLQAGLTLSQLATHLRTSPHHLSQVLNEELGRTLPDFLAERRIAAACLLLAQPDLPYKMEEVAERVGYNARSAFNAAFRKVTGLSPSAWRAQQLAQSHP